MIRARACVKCKCYIVIHPNNPLNQAKINTFEKMHHQHSLVTINLDEIKNEYQSINNNSTNGQEELNSSA